MSGSEDQDGGTSGQSAVPRREFLKTVAVAGGAATAGSLAAPYVSNAQAAAGISLKVQTFWTAGGVGQQIFEAWCDAIKERTSGELEIVPFAAGDIAEVFEMSDAVAGGVLDGMHWPQTYWAATGRMPAGAFFTSFPMGLNHPHQWDILLDSYGGTELARELYAKHRPVFRRSCPSRSQSHPLQETHPVPGGFQGPQDPHAGRVDRGKLHGHRCAHRHPAGPRRLFGVGGGRDRRRRLHRASDQLQSRFADVSDYIVMGPPSTPCLHQPVDLTEVSLICRPGPASRTISRRSSLTRRAPSRHCTSSIQRANVEPWARFAEAGTTVTRLSEDDVARFRQVAIPLWFEWANRDKDAASVFKLHLEVMQNPSVAYLTPDDVKDHELKL